MARKSKLTAKLQKAICDSVAKGNYIDVAARSAGISESTYYSWKRLGEKQKSGMYRDFFMAVREAEAVAEESLVFDIREAGKKHWQANAWLLERTRPSRYARDRVDSGGGNDLRKLTIIAKGFDIVADQDKPEDGET